MSPKSIEEPARRIPLYGDSCADGSGRVRRHASFPAQGRDRAAAAFAKGLDNLLVAGRRASMTHDGRSAARVSGACFVMGEAAGAAAALALGGNTIPREIAVDKLQLQLKQQGAFIGQDQAVPKGL